jgi:hypothetical protein
MTALFCSWPPLPWPSDQDAIATLAITGIAQTGMAILVFMTCSFVNAMLAGLPQTATVAWGKDGGAVSFCRRCFRSDRRDWFARVEYRAAAMLRGKSADDPFGRVQTTSACAMQLGLPGSEPPCAGRRGGRSGL